MFLTIKLTDSDYSSTLYQFAADQLDVIAALTEEEAKEYLVPKQVSQERES